MRGGDNPHVDGQHHFIKTPDWHKSKDDRNLDTVRGSDDPRVGEQGGATLVLELPVLVLAQGHLYIQQFSLCNHSLLKHNVI